MLAHRSKQPILLPPSPLGILDIFSETFICECLMQYTPEASPCPPQPNIDAAEDSNSVVLELLSWEEADIDLAFEHM